MIPLSHSRIKDLECPLRFKILHLDKSEKEPETDIMIIGKDFAKVVEKYRKDTITEGKSASHHNILKAFEHYKPAIQYPDEVGSLVNNFLMSQFLGLPHDADWFAVEQRLAFDWNFNLISHHNDEKDNWFSKDAAFRIKMDFAYLWGNTLYIVDDKTGWGEPEEQQARTYAGFAPLAIPESLRNQIERIIVIFDQVARRDKTLVPSNIDKAWTLDDAEEIRENFGSMLNYVNYEMENFDPAPGPMCSNCWIKQCPYTQRSVELVNNYAVEQGDKVDLTLPYSIDTEEQAKQAIKFMTFTDKARKMVKQMLRDFHNKNGQVDETGFETVEEENKEWKPKDIKSVINMMVYLSEDKDQMKSDVLESLKLSEKDIQRLAYKHGVQEKLNYVWKYGEVKQYSNKFNIKKRKV